MDTNELNMQQLRYCQSRANEIYHNKEVEARDVFYIEDDDLPKDLDDLKSRLKQGKYVYDEERQKRDGDYAYSNVFHFLAWRDPDKPADHKGLTAFLETLNKAYQEFEDKSKLGPAEDRLAALKEFESLPVQ